jgi:predicted ATPase
MRIVEISVWNYKSLRSISMNPSGLNVIVGPNDSGKTNFADCLDFLSEVYRNGLRAAVTQKGGYENIVYRRRSRSTAPIGFSLVVETDSISALYPPLRRQRGIIRCHHTFEFRTYGRGIREEYFVSRESFSAGVVRGRGVVVPLVSMTRGEEGTEVTDTDVPAGYSAPVSEFNTMMRAFTPDSERSASEVMIARYGGLLPFAEDFVESMAQIGVFQFSPTRVRQETAPSPRPQLERYGSNLPTTVDLLQRQFPDIWDEILTSMRRIVPNVKQIEVDYTGSKLLGLLFRESGMKRPWTSHEVSDGTIQTLALLTAIFEPRSKFLLLEEPENSVHPWIIRNLVAACRTVEKRKQILLTTHSPVLIDAVKPADVWLVWRDDEGSHLKRLVELEPSIEQAWKDGTASISEYLDSGAFSGYVPSGVRERESGIPSSGVLG